MIEDEIERRPERPIGVGWDYADCGELPSIPKNAQVEDLGEGADAYLLEAIAKLLT